MQIFLNGESFNVDAPHTVAALIDQLGYTGKRVAVEVNKEIVPRGEHAGHQLRDSDKVEVVAAIGGG
ncbi:MAG: sulfur carrier protein ThiS [Gammaproteobacteria bacterium]|nr:sulfur carrier protein ThiS [Gammaproteobacteria bacterium]